MKTIVIILSFFIVTTFNAYASDTITFTGEYEYRTDIESLDYLGDLVCFFPAQKTAKLAPRKTQTNRLVWFCFLPNQEARLALKVPAKQEGKCGFSANASVVVSSYSDKGGFQPDIAKLEKVIRLGTAKEIPCK